MIGSHNTFSYLPPKRWWMRLLTPWHKCQQWNLGNQVNFANVQYLDIRIRFIDDYPVLVHNNIIYKTPNPTNIFLFQQLKSLNSTKPIPCRLMLDVRKKPKDATKQIQMFKELIDRYQRTPFSKYLTIDDARIYWDWQHPLIKSKYNIAELHTSVCSPWYKYILGTKWFAKRNNIQAFCDDEVSPDNIYLIDYVNIQI